MKEQIFEQYKALMASLSNLPAEIAAAEGDKAVLKRQSADTKRLVEQHEQAIALNIEGKNAEERKARLALALAQDAAYQRLIKAQRQEAEELDTLQVEVDMLTRQYGAVCFEAQLLSGLMQYLSNAKAPVTVTTTDSLGDVVFQPTSYATRSDNNTTYVTSADAAAFDAQQFGNGKSSLDSLGV
jgi:hypothetical protein